MVGLGNLYYGYRGGIGTGGVMKIILIVYPPLLTKGFKA
jgi:hypothetical protein